MLNIFSGESLLPGHTVLYLSLDISFILGNVTNNSLILKDGINGKNYEYIRLM